MRLVLLTEDKSVIPNESDILSQYDNIYLLQFTSIQQTMNAYTYFKGLSLSVEPDMPVETAGKDDSQKTNDSQKESDTDEIIVSKDELQVSEKENPIANLKDVMKEIADNEITVSQDENVIALIDTGVGESANVIDRISVIDDVLTSTGHGNDMLQAIVSQNPDAKVLSIRAMNDNGLGTISSLVAAMEYAINENVDMMNLSLYARTTLSTSVLKSEIQRAVDAGITVIGAAGNDGVDVADYVPGSVEEALIIGAANEKGARLETSNFGKTVDYNVVGDSTSDATAKFTGFVSKNGLEMVSDVLNQGMIYETEYLPDEPEIEIPDEDFSEYEVDETKRAVAHYTFVESDRLKDGDTLDSLYETLEHPGEFFLADSFGSVEMYNTGEGTYKFKVNGPLQNQYVVGNQYADVIFARGNNNGEVLTDGVSMDMTTGVVTVDESVLQRKETDFADIQVQVLVPVVENPEAMQTITVKNNDGSEYTKKVKVAGFLNQAIPMAIDGVDEKLTSDDFDVYLNGSQTPANIHWNDDTKSIELTEDMAATVYSVDIHVKKDVDALFQTAYPSNGNPYPKTDRNSPVLFWLPEGTDVSSWKAGKSESLMCKIGSDKSPARPWPDTVIGLVTGAHPDSVDGDWDDTDWAVVGINKNLFGVDFRCGYYDKNRVWQYYGNWTHHPFGKTETFTQYNSAIIGLCNHISAALKPANEMSMTIKLLDIWTEGDTTKMIMSIRTDKGYAAGGKLAQCVGGTFVCAVKAPEKRIEFSARKDWEDKENAYNTRPQRVGFQAEVRSKPANGSWGNWSLYEGIKYASASNKWTVKWEDALILDKQKTEYEYRIREIVPENYRVDGTHGAIDTKFTIPNVDGQVTVASPITKDKQLVVYKNILNNGYLKIHKASTNPEMTDGNKCYDLSGAEFEIYTDAACTKKASYKIVKDGKEVDGKIVTDKNGDTPTVSLVVGDYWVKETKAPEHFELNPNPVKVQITVAYRVDKPFEMTIEDEPGNDPASVQVEKIWNGPETPTVPPLAGTQFTIWYYDDFFTKDNLPDYDSYNSTAKRKWVIELTWEEDLGIWMAALDDAWLVPGSDPLYKHQDGVTTILPYGTYVFLETKSAPGYETDGVLKSIDENGKETVVGKTNEKYVTQVNKNSGAVELHGGHKYKGENEPKPNRIRIRKIDENGNPLAGAEFTLKNSKGEIVSTKTSGADGYVVWEDLYPDRYTVTEIKTKNQKNLLKDPIVIDLPKRISDADITKYGIDKNKLSEKDPTEGKYFLFDVEYEISNHANFEAPMTGGWTDFMTFVPLIAGMTGLTGVGAVAMKRKKKKK